MNAIAMIARCMRYSENGAGPVDAGPLPESRADVDFIVSKFNEPSLPEEEMGHGNQSIASQIEE